jgi:hypothetical protein
MLVQAHNENQRVEGGLTAILAADMVGFSKLIGEHESGRWLLDHRELIASPRSLDLHKAALMP